MNGGSTADDEQLPLLLSSSSLLNNSSASFLPHRTGSTSDIVQTLEHAVESALGDDMDDDDMDDDNDSRDQNNHETTVAQTFVHLLKGYIGPGMLSLPWAVSQLGIPIGCLGIFIMACWYVRTWVAIVPP